MKKIIYLIALIGLFIVGTQTASAQWNVQVDWTDNCGGCPGGGAHEYSVCLTIKNTCTSQTVYTDCETKSSTSTTHTFNVGEICDIDEAQNCFQVSAVVIKRCVSNQSEICRGTDSKTDNCEAIYNDEITLNCDLES